MDAHPAHGGDMLRTDIHRHPIATGGETLHRVNRAPPSRKRANQARKEGAEFNHKAVHILAELGWTTCAIAGKLEITQRHVQALIKQPCKALAVERREAREREAQAARDANAPFFTEAFPEKEPPLQLDPSLPTGEKVRRYMRDMQNGRVSQAEVARRLGISRQAVSKHVQALIVQQKRTMAQNRSR